MDDFDIIVSEVVDGTVRETPMDSRSEAARQYVGTPAARALTGGDRERLGLAQARARNLEAEENRSTAGVVGQHVVQGVDTLTLGLASAMDEETRQGQLDSREARPGTALAVDGAAWLIPALLSGGESGLATMLTPGGAAARVGLAAERAIGGRLAASGMSPALARGLGITSGAAADGFLSGAMDEVHQSNLHGTPIEAERVLAQAGLGAVLGGVVGGIFAGPAAMLERRVARQTANAAEQAVALPPAPVRALDGQDLSNPMSFQRRAMREESTPFEAGSALVGQNPQQLRVAQAYGNDAFTPEPLARSVRAGADHYERALQASEDAIQAGLDPARRVSASMDDFSRPSAVAPREFQQRLQDALTTARGMTGAGPATDEIDRLLAIVEGANIGSDRGLVAMHDDLLQAFSENDSLRAGLRTGAQSSEAGLPAAWRAATAGLDELGLGRLSRAHRALREHWGADSAAGRFATLRNRGGQGPGGGPRGGLGRSADGNATWVVDGDALVGALEPIAGETPSLGSIEDIARAIYNTDERLAALGDLMGSDVSAARGSLMEAKTALEEMDELARARHTGFRIELAESQNSGMMSAFGGMAGLGTLGAAAGFGLGGPVGAAIGGAVGLAGRTVYAGMTHPGQAIKLLARFGRTGAQAETRLTTSLGRLRGVLNKAEGFSRTARRVGSKSVLALSSERDRREEYAEIRDRVTELASNPDAMTAALSDSARGLENLSPVYSDTIQMAGMRGAQYLMTKLPVADQPSIFSRFEESEPSAVERDSFLRTWEALEDPLATVDWLAEGRLEVEHVEAMQAVYPALYAEVQGRITELVADLDALPSYQQRMSLGILLQVPIDRTMSAGFVHSMQQTFAQTDQQGQAQTSSSRSVSMSYSDDTRTATQSIQQNLN